MRMEGGGGGGEERVGLLTVASLVAVGGWVCGVGHQLLTQCGLTACLDSLVESGLSY